MATKDEPVTTKESEAPPPPPPPTKEKVVVDLKALQKTLTAFPGPKPDLEKWMATLQEAIDFVMPPEKEKATAKK